MATTVTRENLIVVIRRLCAVSEEDVSAKPWLSKWYLDSKLAYGDGNALNMMADLVYARLRPGTTCIASRGNGGVPLGSTIISRHPELKHAIGRDKPRGHGKGGWFDGYVPEKEEQAELVDDVLESGTGLFDLEKVVEGAGAKVVAAHVVAKRGGAAVIPELKIPVDCIFEAKDVEELLRA